MKKQFVEVSPNACPGLYPVCKKENAVKTKKIRLPRKVLTYNEAKTRKAVMIQSIGNLKEEILYWNLRLDKPLEPIDNFIIMSDKTVISPNEIILRNQREIEQKYYIIDNYLNKYLNRENI